MRRLLFSDCHDDIANSIYFERTAILAIDNFCMHFPSEREKNKNKINDENCRYNTIMSEVQLKETHANRTHHQLTNNFSNISKNNFLGKNLIKTVTKYRH